MTHVITQLLDATSVTPALPPARAAAAGTRLQHIIGLPVYGSSIVAQDGTLYALAGSGDSKQLVVMSRHDHVQSILQGGFSQKALGEKRVTIGIVPTHAANAAALRQEFSFLRPKPLGVRRTIGCGDRLGLATPGHVQAVQQFCHESGKEMGLIVAQQSVRENMRTQRTAQNVLDDAMWGIFQQGWREGYGADADHLKNTADADPWVAAGYTLYTIDPGEYVDDSAETADRAVLREKMQALPWNVLASDPDDTIRRLTRPVSLEHEQLTFDEEQVVRAAVKYGRAVAHTVRMFRYLEQALDNRAFELEVSVDETASVTSLADHVYIAAELQRLGVRWVSLAPRYYGDFEKGVDYRGDLAVFRRQFASHVGVARAFGGYKLGLHSGSDKFRIYPIVAEVAGELLHMKTAGTSYLEALHTVADAQPELFRHIMQLALKHYETDRATYIVSGRRENVPPLDTLADDELAGLLKEDDARQVLHVTYGTVLQNEALRTELMSVLQQHETQYTEYIAKHFNRHLAAFR